MPSTRGFSGSYYHSSSSSSYRNPCPDGYSIGTLVLETLFDDSTSKNITFLVCNPGSNGSDNSLALGLGLGLGLGIPVLLFIMCAIYRCKRDINERRDFEQHIRQQLPPLNNNNQNNYQNNEVVPISTPSVFDKLGFHLHRQFLAGNITNEFKVIIKSFTIEDLEFLENFAREHNKSKMADYIRSEIDSKNNFISVMPSAPPSQL